MILILIPEVWTEEMQLFALHFFSLRLGFIHSFPFLFGPNPDPDRTKHGIRADLDPDPKSRFKTNIFPNYVPYQITQPTSWPKLQIIKMLKKSSPSPEYIFRISDGIDIFGNLISYREKILYIHCFYI